MTTNEGNQAPAWHPSAGANVDPEIEAIAERLWTIIHACGGSSVDSDGDHLWFEVESADDLQIRLSGDRTARSYDRAASFGISYGSSDRAATVAGSHGTRPSSDPVSSRFLALVERIKALDSAPLPGLARAFRPAALAVVHRLTTASEPPPASEPTPTSPHVESESALGQALNVVFVDLCADLGGGADALRPLHWGFWPITAGTPARAADIHAAQEAFSLNLLSHIPDAVSRILDVGCGLGFNERFLSARGKRVTAISPVPHHCAVIENARIENVVVRCTRFEDMEPEEPFDLVLFSESVNHFTLNDAFMRHCCRFLTDAGFMLMADDLSAERIRQIEEQTTFRVLGTWDITEHVAPTAAWFAPHAPVVAAYRRALLATLELHDVALAAQVRTILDSLENSDLKALLSAEAAPPTPKGRYMVFLLQREAPAASH